MTYPQEKQQNLKDANRKLRAEVKRLKNIIREQNKQLKQMGKSVEDSIDHIDELVEYMSVEECIEFANKRTSNKPDTKQEIKKRLSEIYSGKRRTTKK